MSRQTRDWIFVRGGTPEGIQKAVVAHTGIAARKVSSVHRVTVHRFVGDGHAVRFDPPLPPYAFANLIGWLDDPRRNAGAAGAVGWFTSPGTGVRYYLAPKRAGRGGDTLVGASEAGEGVEVFLPTCRLRRSRNDAPPPPEPEPTAGSDPVAEFEIEVDADRSFGNPDFVPG